MRLGYSLSNEQRNQIGKLAETVDLAPQMTQAEQAGSEGLRAAMSELQDARDTLSAELRGILTAEQYDLFQQSLLPLPELSLPDVEPQSTNDCLNAYYQAIYANSYAYNWYASSYLNFLYSTDPFRYQNHVLGYYVYLYNYRTYQYAYQAYTSGTNSYYADYYSSLAVSLIWNGVWFAWLTDNWCDTSYSYTAYSNADYAADYIQNANHYAPLCNSQSCVSTRAVSAIQQSQTNWCWAASSQMVMSYDGTSVSQCSQANYLFGQSNCCSYPSSSACNKGATEMSINQNLSHWGYTNDLTDPISFSDLQNQIDWYWPFIAGWSWYGGGRHALVVRGYDRCNSYVYFIDPWDGGFYYSGYQWFRYSSYDHTWDASWINIDN